MASKSTMRRRLVEAGYYFSSAMQQWCIVHERWGATYFHDIEEAYEHWLASPSDSDEESND